MRQDLLLRVNVALDHYLNGIEKENLSSFQVDTQYEEACFKKDQRSFEGNENQILLMKSPDWRRSRL